MDGDKKDFKAVKVNIKSGTKNVDTLSRSMLYSGINIFGQLTQQYLANKEAGLSAGTREKSLIAGLGAEAAAGQDVGDLMNLPAEVMLIFKRVQKRDPITKCKAFKELDDYLSSIEKYSEEHQNLLAFFLYHYCRILVNEVDKKVREAAQITLGNFIQKGVKRLGPHMSKIFPIWFCSFFDTSPDVAAHGQRNFKEAFKANGDRVFKISFKYFLHFADEHLKQTQEQLAENSTDLSKVQMEELFDRVISSIFQALAESFKFTESWAEEDKAYYIKKMLSYLDLKRVKPEENVEEAQIVQKKNKESKQVETKLWQYLTKAHRGRVRSACLMFIAKFIQNVPRETSEAHLGQIAPLILEMISEDNQIVQNTLWREVFFTLGKEFPSVWSMVSLKKSFNQGLMVCLKNAGYGASFGLYPNLVKFTSVFPLFQLVDFQEDKGNKFSVKDRAKFLTQFYQHLFAGLKDDNASYFHRDLSGAYFETLAFLLLKRFAPFAKTLSPEDETYQFVWSQLQMVIELPLVDFISKYEKFSSKVQNERNIRSTIPERYCGLIKALSERGLDDILLDGVIKIIFDALSDKMAEPNALRFAKAFVKQRSTDFGQSELYLKNVNEKINVKLVEKMFELELKTEIKAVGRKTLDATLAKCTNFKKLVVCMAKHGLGDSCFRNISIDKFLELIKDLDPTEERAAKILDQKEMVKLHQIKQQLIILSLTSMNRENTDPVDSCQAFFKYVLIESKIIKPELKKLVILPPDSPLGVKSYYKCLRKHSKIVCQYIAEALIADSEHIEHNWDAVDSILRQAFDEERTLFQSREEGNKILQLLQSKLSSCSGPKETCFYLKAATHILTNSPSGSSESAIFDQSLLLSLQGHLINSIFGVDNLDQNGSSSFGLWQLFEQIIKAQENESLLDNCRTQLKSTMTLVIKEIEAGEGGLGSYVGRVDALTKMVMDFVSLVEPARRQAIIQAILMNEENFQNCEKNCLPMKIFRDMFLQGGVSFDVQSLFSSKDELQYAWFASLLLNINNMSSLNNLPDLKRQLSVFLETEIIPAIIISVKQGSKKLILRLIESFKKQITAANDSCLSTLENLIHKVVDPGEEFGFDEPLLKVDDFKHIFALLSKEKASEFVNRNYSSVSKTDIKLMSSLFKHTAYFILDEPEISGLMKLAKRNLHIDILTKSTDMLEVTQSLSLYLSLYPHFKTDYDTELQEALTQWVIGNFTDNFVNPEADSDTKMFHLNVILDFLAQMMDVFGMNHFNQIISHIPDDTYMATKQAQREARKAEEAKKEQITEANKEKPAKYDEEEASLETLILQVVKISHEIALEPMTYINLLTLVRKVIPNDKIITEQQFLIDEVIEIAKDKVVLFQKKLKHFLGQADQASSAKDSQQHSIMHQEDTMLACFAETLMTCAPYLNQDVSETSLYILISSGFPSLQKAAFYMLSYLYQNYIPRILFKKDVEQEIKQLMLLAEGQEPAADEEKEEDKEGEGDDGREEQAKDKREFKNVAQPLVDLIENPPQIDHESQNSMEAMIFGKTQEGCLSKTVFGYLLAWSSVLRKIDCGGIKAQLADRDDYTSIIGTITEYLEQNRHVYQMLLVIIVAYLPKVKKVTIGAEDLRGFEPAQMDLDDPQSTKLMSLHTLVAFMKSFPSLARKYYQDCDKQLLDIVMPYIKQVVSPAILDNEIQKIEVSQIALEESGQGEGLTFALFKSTKEIVAEYTKGEVSMQLKIQIPTDYPLRSVAVELGQQLRITERQKSKWVLAIKNLLQIRNGDIISAVLLWKSNIDKEIDGVEDCFICYCVLHPTDKSLPRMPCKNCKNKFHVACVSKWFRTSNKSNCPLCQAYFF